MNFALPGIFVFLGIDSIDNSDFPVSPSTATLSLSPDHTEHWDNVGVGGVTKLGELRPDLTAGLPGPHLVPPGQHEAVALDVGPAGRTVPSWGRAGAESREIRGVAGAVCLHQHHHQDQDQQVGPQHDSGG